MNNPLQNSDINSLLKPSDQALISVILPTKNSIQYLQERIDSLENQTYKNLEFICIDTASTDGTLELLTEWKKRDSRVTIYDTPPGLYAAWNTGIKKATGQYIYIATSDDTMVPSALEQMCQALNRHPDCDLCDTILTLIDTKGKSISQNSHLNSGFTYHLDFKDTENLEETTEVVRPGWEDVLRHCSGRTVYTSIAQLLIRTSLFQKTGYFPEDCGSAGDYLWGFRAAIHTNILYLPRRLTMWRLHANQATGHSCSFIQSAKQMFKMLNIGISEIQQLPVKQAAFQLKKLPELKNLLSRHREDQGVMALITESIYVCLRHPIFFGKMVFCIPLEITSQEGTIASRCYCRLFKKECKKAIKKTYCLLYPT